MSRKETRKELADDIRTVFNAADQEEAKRYLNKIVQKYEEKSPHLSRWLEENVPESPTVFTIPKKHRKKLRTSNMAERQMKVAMIFPNKQSLNRIVAAILMETDETWETGKRYLDMEID